MDVAMFCLLVVVASQYGIGHVRKKTIARLRRELEVKTSAIRRAEEAVTRAMDTIDRRDGISTDWPEYLATNEHERHE